MKQRLLRLKTRYDDFFRTRRLEGIREIISFVVITLIIHYGWRFWEINLKLFPVYDLISVWMDDLAHLVKMQAVWLWNHVMGYNVSTEGKVIFFSSGYDIAVGRSCSGTKQIMQFVLLMLVYRGKWVHKLWFIPLGALLVHFTNLFRIYMSGVLSMNKPEWMEFAHDHILRWMFYLVICGMWLLWVKKIQPPLRNFQRR